MASSRKPKSSEVAACVADAVRAHVPAGAQVVVGLSGGVDSVVLFDALAAIAPAAGFALRGLHVHHGLNPAADRWAGHCADLGRRRGIPVEIVRVRVDRDAGLGVERAAREARYAAYRAAGADVIALAHHLDDQAETLLLQLVRGAGVAGLAGMPPWQPGTPALWRPLLGVARATLEAVAREQGLEWVHDDSNDDTRLARNAVRHRVVPLLRDLNPAAAANLARSAAHLAEAHEMLGQVGRADLAACAAGERLRIDALLGLGAARARNALRVRLHDLGAAPPSTRRLDALMSQLAAPEDGRMLVRLDGLEARRFRGELWLVRPLADPAPGFRRVWSGDVAWVLPELGGVLEFEPTVGEGVDAALVRPGTIEVRVRAGGERLSIGAGRPHRSLKNLFQESVVPPWERPRVPLVYCNGRLAWVPGIGSDPALSPSPGGAGIRVRWTRR